MAQFRTAPLDPRVREVLSQMRAGGIAASHTLSVAEARGASRERRALLRGAPEPVHRVRDAVIPGPGGALPVRVYAPKGAGLPVLVYLHGGGWVLGDLDSVDPLCRIFANGAGCLVVSVDYRLAPEHPFPAAPEDAYAALRWAAENAQALGADARRIAIGGDSAGGNLAAAATLMARDRGGPALVYQVLNMPVTNFAFDTPSYEQFADDYPLARADMQWFWRHYLARPADGGQPYASPLRAADLRRLPPGLVVTAELDPLRDEGEAYAARLREAGVAVETRRYAGMVHGFTGMAASVDQARRALDEIQHALRAAFAV